MTKHYIIQYKIDTGSEGNLKLLYLETDASGIGLGAALLQLMDNMFCQKDTAPDNTILCPIAFVSKSLTGTE